MAVRTARGATFSAREFVVVALVAVVGLLLGLFGSAFGPLYPAVVGAFAVATGVVVAIRGAHWGRVPLTLGVAVLLGAALYIVIGVVTPDGAGDGSGSSCGLSSACE